MSKVEHELGASLRCSVEVQSGVTRVELSGNVSENADFTPLKRLSGRVTVDLSQIGRINSPGVRAWILFVRDCENAGMDLTFERCTPVIVSQLGMISNFMGTRSRVRSVLAPYVCTSCHAEEFAVLELVPGTVSISRTRPCPTCKGTMELDELEETYTALLDGR